MSTILVSSADLVSALAGQKAELARTYGTSLRAVNADPQRRAHPFTRQDEALALVAWWTRLALNIVRSRARDERCRGDITVAKLDTYPALEESLFDASEEKCLLGMNLQITKSNARRIALELNRVAFAGGNINWPPPDSVAQNWLADPNALTEYLEPAPFASGPTEGDYLAPELTVQFWDALSRLSIELSSIDFAAVSHESYTKLFVEQAVDTGRAVVVTAVQVTKDIVETGGEVVGGAIRGVAGGLGLTNLVGIGALVWFFVLR